MLAIFAHIKGNISTKTTSQICKTLGGKFISKTNHLVLITRVHFLVWGSRTLLEKLHIRGILPKIQDSGLPFLLQKILLLSQPRVSSGRTPFRLRILQRSHSNKVTSGQTYPILLRIEITPMYLSMAASRFGKILIEKIYQKKKLSDTAPGSFVHPVPSESGEPFLM